MFPSFEAMKRKELHLNDSPTLSNLTLFDLLLMFVGGILKDTLRPPMPERCDHEWRKLMEQCWSADPEARPSFTEIRNRLRSMSAVLQAKGNNSSSAGRANANIPV